MKINYLTSSIILLVSVCLLFPYLLFFTAGAFSHGMLFEEDGVFEYASALWFLISSLIFLFLFVKFRIASGSIRSVNIGSYLMILLSFLFFVFAGEEISWGQRILNIETPDLLKEINVQREINLHNIRIFDVTDSDGYQPKKGLARMITANRLFSLFWFVLCVIIPILNRINRRFAALMKKTFFPVAPLWISGLFLVNFLVSKAIQETGYFQDLYVRIISKDLLGGFLFRLTEIKEYGYAFLFLVMSLEFLFRSRNYITEKFDPSY